MSELKPCPFCGCKDIGIETIEKYENHYLYCKHCNIEQPLYNSLEEAIDAWNRRTNNAKTN